METVRFAVAMCLDNAAEAPVSVRQSLFTHVALLLCLPPPQTSGRLPRPATSPLRRTFGRCRRRQGSGNPDTSLEPLFCLLPIRVVERHLCTKSYGGWRSTANPRTTLLPLLFAEQAAQLVALADVLAVVAAGGVAAGAVAPRYWPGRCAGSLPLLSVLTVPRYWPWSPRNVFSTMLLLLLLVAAGWSRTSCRHYNYCRLLRPRQEKPLPPDFFLQPARQAFLTPA